MKDYFRLLSFAKPIEKFAIPYVITTLLYILFNTLNLALLAPLLDTLFNHKSVEKAGQVVKATAQVKEQDWWDVMGQFRRMTDYFISTYSEQETLKFVCLIIVCSVLLSNIFKYFSSRTMEDLRVHTLLNLRKTVFNNVMNLHLGYFNSQRKGDIISKVSADVQVVQFTVTNTLQVVFKRTGYAYCIYSITFLNLCETYFIFAADHSFVGPHHCKDCKTITPAGNSSS